MAGASIDRRERHGSTNLADDARGVLEKERSAVARRWSHRQVWPRRGEHVRVPFGRGSSQIEGNKVRDRRVNRALRERGWKVVRIWQRELKKRDEAKLVQRLAKVVAA